MESFWHTRVVPYAVGVVEFAQNLVYNVRQAAGLEPKPAEDNESFEGKVEPFTSAPRRNTPAAALLIQDLVFREHHTRMLKARITILRFGRCDLSFSLCQCKPSWPGACPQRRYPIFTASFGYLTAQLHIPAHPDTGKDTSGPVGCRSVW